MEYVISDKDMDTILVQGWDFRRLIKSKQPVEQTSYRIADNTHIDDTKIFRFTMTNCELAKTNNIKIYIQAGKEKNV